MYNNKASEWKRHSKFRSRLGNSVLRPFLERVVVADDTGTRSHGVTVDVRDSLETMVRVWTNLDCLGGDEDSDSATLIDDISRLILRIDTVPTNSSNIGGGDNTSSPPRNSDETFVKDTATDIEINSMDVDTPERTRDASSTTEQKQEDEHRIVNSNSEDASMGMPLTPTATDDDMFGAFEDEDGEDQEESPQKSVSEMEKAVMAENKVATTIATNQSSLQEKEFDFESEGIPHQKVEINQLQTPCKSIATVQITRDLHSDTAHSVSSLLSTVPDTVLEACRDALESSPKGKDNDNKRGVVSIDLKSLPTIPDPVLDLNLKQILSNVRSHRDIIQKQWVARKTLVDLLVQSRCQFGSRDTAEIYYGLRETIDRLQSCKSKVLDAMELEGLDREGIDGNGDPHGDSKEGGGDKEGKDVLKDFEWFTREQAEGEKRSKRVRLG